MVCPGNRGIVGKIKKIKTSYTKKIKNPEKIKIIAYDLFLWYH